MSMTFKEVAEAYLEMPSAKFSEKVDMTRILTEKLIAEFGDTDMREFERKAIILKYQAKLKTQQKKRGGEGFISTGTQNTYLAVLRAIIRFAHDDLEVIDRVPKITLYQKNKREFYFEPEQMIELCRRLDPLRANMVKFSCNTGLRASNVRLLKWDQLSDDYKWLSLSGSITKNGEQNQIPLNAEARKILGEMRAHCFYMQDRYPYLGKLEYVFVKESHRRVANGKPFHKTSICNESWQKAVAMAGLPKGTCFHHCRHTFASWHMMAGTSETALQQLGGWRSESSMKRYTHLSQAHKAKAVKALDGMY